MIDTDCNRDCGASRPAAGEMTGAGPPAVHGLDGPTFAGAALVTKGLIAAFGAASARPDADPD